MRRSFAAGIVGIALLAGACSTPVYTSATAVHDLEVRSNLTQTQAQCIVNGIRRHFEAEVVQHQRQNKLSALPADQLKLEIDGALAALKAPTGSEIDATRRAITQCAPNALN